MKKQEEIKLVYFYQNLGQPIGQDLHKKLQKIIEKYPEEFVWEAQYRAIPKKVHDAYWEEMYGFGGTDDFEPYKIEWDNKTTPKQKGFIEILDEAKPIEIEPIGKLVDFMSKIMNDNYQEKENRREEKLKLERRNRNVWNKYYKIYGLKFRK